jgi:TPR repeat protein
VVFMPRSEFGLFPAAFVAKARAEDQGVIAEFYSYLPASPEIHLPEIRIPFWTDDLKTAKRAYQDGKYGRALKYFRRASDDGNVVADWYLGHMYRMGRGVIRDDATAYSYYSRVADLYDPDEPDINRLRVIVDAMVRVADYQRTGVPSAGIPQDSASAARTYLKIATTYGHPSAQFALGLMNIEGQGMRANPQQGLKWLIAAARKRQPQAEAYLGELYWEGRIVRQDKTRAVMWYVLARESARPEENPEIFDRAAAFESAVTEDIRLEAEARARVWDDQYPTGNRINAATGQ